MLRLSVVLCRVAKRRGVRVAAVVKDELCVRASSNQLDGVAQLCRTDADIEAEPAVARVLHTFLVAFLEAHAFGRFWDLKQVSNALDTRGF